MKRYVCSIKVQTLLGKGRKTPLWGNIYFSADLLEETVLTMLNKELMVRGNAAKENQSLVSFQKSCIIGLKKKIAECQNRKNSFRQRQTA